jgi:hypothetical protein
MSVASTDRAHTPHVSASHTPIQITNPPAGHPGFIGPKHAERWVKQGKAFWEAGGRLRLFDKIRGALAQSRAGKRVVPGGAYDSIRRQMRPQERRAIPIAQPPPRPTRRKIVVAHSGPAGRVQTFTEAELAKREATRHRAPTYPLHGSFVPKSSPAVVPIARKG